MSDEDKLIAFTLNYLELDIGKQSIFYDLENYTLHVDKLLEEFNLKTTLNIPKLIQAHQSYWQERDRQINLDNPESQRKTPIPKLQTKQYMGANILMIPLIMHRHHSNEFYSCLILKCLAKRQFSAKELTLILTCYFNSMTAIAYNTPLIAELIKAGADPGRARSSNI